MNLTNIFSNYASVWRKQSITSKITIFASLLLVIVAYLPTLQFDYVTQDQWRAFRYSTESESPIKRAKACVRMLPEFYVQTGRPFIWMTECIEHSVVSKIKDFAYLRPFVLAIVLISVIHLGLTLSPALGELSLGFLAASIFVVAPAYSFMYLQSTPAAMVLISIILAAASFNNYHKSNICQVDRSIGRLFAAFLLFVCACMIYPAYAFVVIPIIGFTFGLDNKKTHLEKFYSLVLAYGFYLIAAIIYYIYVKVSVFVLSLFYPKLQDLQGYEVAIQLTPAVIWDRLQQLFWYFYTVVPFNFYMPAGASIVILIIFSIVLGSQSHYKNKQTAFQTLFVSAAIFVLTASILMASVSPWLFSQMNGLVTRHVLPWYLFFAAATITCFFILLKNLPKKIERWIPLIILVFFVIPIELFQNKLSILEVVVTNIEIQTMRTQLSEWLINNTQKSRHILVVLPVTDRPSAIENLIRFPNHFDNAVMASSQNPVSIPWMINAVLREHEKNLAFNIVDCASNQDCALSKLQNRKNVVVSYTNKSEEFRSSEEPLIINLSLLTSIPVIPKIELVKYPVVSASSIMGGLGPEGLLTSQQPGWHAGKNPIYPQSLTIDFKEKRSFSKIQFLPQDNLTNRMPDNVILQASDDGVSWSTVLISKNLCHTQDTEGWHSIALGNTVKVQFLRIEILKNCGDPALLTLRGLKFE